MGIQGVILAEVSSGYVYDWKLYEGKKYLTQKKNLSFSIVTDLVTGLENKGHKLYADNYYTSIDLALALTEKQIGLTGTIRSNRRRLPENIMKIKKIEKGKSLVARSGNIQFLRWKDKKDVYMVSTVYDAFRNNTSEKPNMIQEYNNHMRGVDRGDQMASYYSFDHRSIKWWKRVLFSLMETALLNSYIIYKKAQISRFSLLQFREHVVSELWSDYASSLVQENAPLNIPRLSQKHELSQRVKKNCYVCSTSQIRKTTTYYCVECDKNVHAVPCFKVLHEKLELRYRNKILNN